MGGQSLGGLPVPGANGSDTGSGAEQLQIEAGTTQDAVAVKEATPGLKSEDLSLQVDASLYGVRPVKLETEADEASLFVPSVQTQAPNASGPMHSLDGNLRGEVDRSWDSTKALKRKGRYITLFARTATH